MAEQQPAAGAINELGLMVQPLDLLARQRRSSGADHSLASLDQPHRNVEAQLPNGYTTATVIVDIRHPHTWILPRQRVSYSIPGSSQIAISTLESTFISLVHDAPPLRDPNNLVAATAYATATPPTQRPEHEAKSDRENLQQHQQQRPSNVLDSNVLYDLFRGNGDWSSIHSSRQGQFRSGLDAAFLEDLEPLPFAERFVHEQSHERSNNDPSVFSQHPPHETSPVMRLVSDSAPAGPASDLHEVRADDTATSHPTPPQTPFQPSESANEAPHEQAPLKPLTPYNYFFRSERDNIVNGMQHASDPIPEPDVDFSEAKRNALLHQRWYVGFKSKTSGENLREEHQPCCFCTVQVCRSRKAETTASKGTWLD
jgi:hypothetical protein